MPREAAPQVAASPPAATASGAAPPGASPPGASRSCERSAALEVLSHDIELEVSLDPPSLTGKGSVRVKAIEPTASVVLDARDLAVSRFLVGSRAVSFEQTPERVCATLPQPLAAGSEQTLELEWRASTTRNNPKFSKNDVWAGYGTSAWMPTLQDAAQRATLALHITVSAELKVAASGRTREQQPLADGRVRHSFVLERPSPPFLYAFALGRFDAAELRVDDVLLRALGPVGVDLKPALQATGAMYRFLRSQLGVPHPWGEYLQIFPSDDGAAQEAAGMSLIGASALDDLRAEPRDDWLFIHELSHQWFGWLVPCADFADFWLNEGFATFMTGAFKQSRWGAAAYERELANWRARSAKAHEQGRDAPIALSSSNGAPRPAPRDSELQDRGISYFRGALVLHRLRAELGEEPFWRGVRQYLATGMQGRGARTVDLRRALEAASGRDLGAFFERWVYNAAADL